MASAKMTRVADSGRVDFSTWGLPIKAALRDIVEEMAEASLAEVVEIAMQHDLHAYMPHEWNLAEDHASDGMKGAPPADPLTVYVQLPLGKDSDGEPAWSFTLTELVDSMIDFHDYPDHRGIVLIRDGLAELVRKLDEAIAANAAAP